jgi:hypothetical protein
MKTIHQQTSKVTLPQYPHSMTTRIQQAISDGYIERRGNTDREFNAYFGYCQTQKRPFVRLERRRTHYRVEVELSSLSHRLTEPMQHQALDMFLAVLPGRPKANSHFSPGLIFCDRIPPEHARRIGSELFALASAAPHREQAGA